MTTEAAEVAQPGAQMETAVPSLWSLFFNFLKIGSTTFGGFMALISVVQNDLVERKRLMKQEDMLDGISLATILPGPVAMNVVAYAGYRLRGGWGALVSALGVTLPSFILMLTLTIAYFRWGQLPTVTKIFMGFIPAVSAIIVAAAWNMGRKQIKGWPEAVIAVAAAALLLSVGGFLISLGIIVAGGIVGWLWFGRGAAKPPAGKAASSPAEPDAKPNHGGKRLHAVSIAPLALTSMLGVQALTAGKLLFTFGGMSLLLFGGGYVFIPMIHDVVVTQHGWVTQQEFIDGIALGQIMPGPILISAAFIGYKVQGFLGAFVATVGMFVPPAILMIVASRFFARIKASAPISAALRGIRPAVIGMIVAAAWTIGKTAHFHWLSVVIFALALLALLRLRVQVAWIIPAAGATGLLFY